MNDADNKAYRAGRYVRQIAGYRAFIPEPLPPDPPIKMDQEMLQLLSLANHSLGRLDGATEILPNPDLFVAMYVRKEALLSSQIEGTQASLMDILEFETAAVEPENPQDVEEVVNYIKALGYGLERLSTLPLSLRLIREIHMLLMQGVRGSERRPGEFRSSQNWIGHQGCTLETAKFVPPPVAEMHRALGDIERFLHEDMLMPFLIKVGLVHAQFETVHPFLDGNGRMGRLLITFLLCQKELLRKPLLYLSYYFKQNKEEYYELLQHVRNSGDWEAWLKFFLQGVHVVAQEATDTARNIVQLRERHRSLVMENLGSSVAPGLKLLEFLFERPIISVKLAADAINRQYPNANRIINSFQELGILREITQQERNRLFMYSEYYDMFDEQF